MNASQPRPSPPAQTGDLGFRILLRLVSKKIYKAHEKALGVLAWVRLCQDLEILKPCCRLLCTPLSEKLKLGSPGRDRLQTAVPGWP